MVEFGNLGSLIRSAGCALLLDPTSYILQDQKAPSRMILTLCLAYRVDAEPQLGILAQSYLEINNINEPPLMQRYELIIAFIGQDDGRRSEVQ
jgi:hypothetical protein